MPTPKAVAIAEAKERFRQSFVGGPVLVTHHVENLEAEVRSRVLEAVRQFSDFKPDNDRHQERDFGSVAIDGETYFWKIDLYDESYERGSPCPADPSVTRRVLTVMHIHEW